MDRLFARPVATTYDAMPKVDLHRHLEGSLRVTTLIDIAHKHSLTLPMGVMRLNRMVQVQDEEPFTVENFLSKFNTLRLFYRSPEVIHRITREAIEDAAKDNVKYLELRFTPVALSRAERFPLADVVQWVCQSTQEAAKKYNINVRLIASVNRHESPDLAEQVAWLAAARMDQGIVGLDLAGNEADFPAEPFKSIFREARQSGLKLTVHAGEWGGPENVRQAIEAFDADRIGHGVRVLEDAYTVALAKDRQTAFEVCMTSNYQTGVVKEIKHHPIKKMLEAGLNVTINTDDPSISQITLSEELKVAVEYLEIGMPKVKEVIMASITAAFLPDGDKAKISDYFKKNLK